MNINEILFRQGMTKYKLAKVSGVPHTTINDICSEKTRIEKCTVETLFRLSKPLGVTMEELVENGIKGGANMEYRSSLTFTKATFAIR